MILRPPWHYDAWPSPPDLSWPRATRAPAQPGPADQVRDFFFRQADFPRFRKKGQSDSFCYPDPKQIKPDQGNSRIFLPKPGWIRCRNSRQVTGIVKNVTVSQSCGKWYISIQTESEVSTPVHSSASMVGLDVGVAKLATLSDGTVFEPVNSFQKNQKKLAVLQRPVKPQG
ncbi:transposase [Salmonella enterica]|nr:transposase [Salmonella enterica]EBW3899516.1 transposase [Salmonella enterica subsp. enterica serovar Panama]EDB3637407.1 transposase [Salmonella enterica subsp. enterica serovar Oranienburg]EDQ4202410.1 transposase [Salmonella enterica subsp. enterica serovar Glostrup]EBM0566808.1 transposase [Salmonella enterica]